MGLVTAPGAEGRHGAADPPDTVESAFRRGFQQGAMAGRLARRRYDDRAVEDWVTVALYKWRYGKRDNRREPPGMDGQPWPNMYVYKPDDSSRPPFPGGPIP